MFLNVGQESNNLYKSFINHGTSSNNSGLDGKKTDGLDFLLKYKEEKRQKELTNAQIGENKPYDSSKVIDNGNKFFLNPSDNSQYKMFHEHSALDLSHAPKNNSFEPAKTPLINKMETYTKPYSQFDSPTQNSNSQQQYNKYSSPQQQGPSQTFFNKYNSDNSFIKLIVY